METIIIIAVVIFIINAIIGSQQKKRRQQDARPAQRDPRQISIEAQLEEQRSAAEAERRRTMQPTVRTTLVPRQSGWHCVCGRDNGADSAYCVKCGRPREEGQSGSLYYDSGEGRSAPSEMGGYSGEGASVAGDTEGYSTEGRREGKTLAAAKSSLRHAVKSVTESRHAHTESSMTGIQQECEEDYDPHARDSYDLGGADAYALASDAQAMPYGIALRGGEDIARGVLYAEILGKPRALRGR